MNTKSFRTIVKVILVLICASAVWAIQKNKCCAPTDMQQAIEKAILVMSWM
jgi:hypothetical protein